MLLWPTGFLSGARVLFSNFVAATNFSLQQKRIMFNYPNSSKIMFITLNLLISEGMVSGYNAYIVKPANPKKFLFKNQRKFRFGISILFHYKKGRYNVLHNTEVVSTPGWFKFISYYKLRSLLFKAPSSVLLISSAARGFVASYTANKLKLGGKAILKAN